MQAELIYNPYGGQVVIRHELDNVVALLSRYGWSVTLRETSKPLEATELARHAVNRGAKVVIAAGGDGTVNEVANGLLNTDVVMGVLPVGTTNSWALQMGIPALNPMLPGTQMVKLIADLEERIAHPLPANYYRKVLLDATRVLIEGRTVAVDVGELSGRYFLMWAGIGLDAAVLESISLKGKRALGSWAYVFTAIGSGYRYPRTDVLLKLDTNILLNKFNSLVMKLLAVVVPTLELLATNLDSVLIILPRNLSGLLKILLTVVMTSVQAV